MATSLPRRRTSACSLALVALLAGACSKDKGVGGDVELGATSTSTCRLGECTTTTSTTAPTTTTAATRRTTSTTAATTTTTTRPASATSSTTSTTTAASIVVRVQADDAEGGPFDPPQARVRVGSVVRWTNADSVARSVQADNGAFRSPPIPPGGSFDFRTTTAGRFNYHDGTRPYAVAVLEVV